MSRQKDPLWSEIESLRSRLMEALEALEAIRSGDADALVVYKDDGERVYTLQGAEQPYRVMVEAMNEGAATLSEDGLILWANACLADMLDTPLEILLGSPLHAHLSGESRPVFEDFIDRKPLERGKLELDFKTDSGRFIPVLVSVSPLAASPDTAHLCLVLTDLTEQNRSAELAAAERMAAAIIDQAAEPVVVCDRDGRVVRASQSAARLANMDPLDQPFEAAFPLCFDMPEQTELSSDEAKPPVEPLKLAEVLRGRSIHGLDAYLECQEPLGSPTRVNLAVSAAPLYLAGADSAWGCIITMTDLSERKRAEERIRQYARQLERSNQDLQNFAFAASHDLQEPLRKIRAFGYRLKEKFSDLLSDEGIDYLVRMQSAEERMRTMIEELLDYSRYATEPQEFADVDLNQVVRGVLSDLEVQINQSGGRVEVQSLPVIQADPTQMRQLFQNLLSNALKFHQKGNPPVVQIHSEPAGASRIEIQVTDNGVGFPMEHLDIVFQPFVRLHGRSEFTGSGIGLATCRRIVERHNGAITAVSEPGKGSTFIVTLPVRQEPERI